MNIQIGELFFAKLTGNSSCQWMKADNAETDDLEGMGTAQRDKPRSLCAMAAAG
jgi:hypothetical protein